MSGRPYFSRRGFLAASGAAGASLALARGRAARAAEIGKPEKSKLTLGLAVPAASFLPVYVAKAHTWAPQGLQIEIISFRGDAEVSQALAGDSIDLSLQSLDGLINLISSNQPVKGFFAGFHQADFAWVAQPSVKDWNGLKGGTVGVSTFGSLSDALTRYVLKKHGLEPEKDVQIVQAGPSASSIQALKSGRLTGGIQSAPTKFVAEDAGLTVLGTQAKEVAPQWPKHSFLAKTPFIEKNPNTVKAFLRAHVAAIRLAKAERAMAVQLLIDNIKYQPDYAARAYDEVIAGFDERGRLPDQKYMDVFWSIQIAAGEIKEAWPADKLLDDRFIKSFDDWAPAP
jgi:NitT/TauT family transport system substrate-binding protein